MLLERQTIQIFKMKKSTRSRVYKGYDFRARMSQGSLHLTVSKEGVYLERVPAGCNSPEDALKDAVLDKALENVLANPLVQKKLGQIAGKAKQPPVETRTFRMVLENLKMGRHWKGDNNHYRLRWAKEFIMDSLAPTKKNPEDVREFPLDQVTYEQYYPVRDRLDAADVSDEARYQNATWLKRVTDALIDEGLSRHCADLFKGIKSRLQHEAAGEPFTYAELNAMLEMLPKSDFEPQFLFWLAFSGAPELSDCAGLELTQIERDTGLVTFNREGTVDGAEFALVGDGLTCFCNQLFAPGQIYVFPNLIYTDEDRRNPDYLQQRVDLHERRRAKHIRKMAARVWENLMATARVSGPGKSFSSMRKEVYAFLHSMEFKATVAAKMQGVSLGTLRRYEFPAEWEFFALRDLREKHLAAIRRKEPGHYVISKTQVLQEVQAFIKDYTQTLARVAAKVQVRLKKHVDQAFKGVSDSATQGLNGLQRAQTERHVQTALKINQALNNTSKLAERLNDLRFEIASEYGFDCFNLPDHVIYGLQVKK